MDVIELLGHKRLTGRDTDPASQDVPDFTDEGVPDDISGLDDLLDPDPAPKRAREPRATGTADRLKKIGASTPVKVSAKQKSEIQDALEMIQVMLGGTIQLRDAHCGGVIVEHSETIAKKAVPIICRNPQWVAWFTGGTGWLDVLGLIIALRPVVGTFWGHHITHTIKDGEDGNAGTDDLSAFTAPAL